MDRINKNEYIPAKKYATHTTGEIIKMPRELKGWTQEDPAKKCGIKAA